MLGSSMGMWMAPELRPDGWRGQQKFQMTNLTMPNNISSMKYSLKSVPVPPDVEVLPLAVPEQKLIIFGSYSLNSRKAGIPR